MKKVIGIEQVNDEQVEHYATDFRPWMAFGIFAALTVLALIVAEVTK